jgi:phenylalanyl-tRNA synthetase beta chain
MKFTLSWLKEHLDTEAPAEELADKLTWLGLEVENLSNPGKTLAPFIVAKVESAEKHPNADRLKLCVVDTGKEKLQVVCGAANARAGIKAVFALPGTTIPSSGVVLKVTKIRDVESNGMLCSASELQLSEASEGIIELPEDAPVGESFATYRKLNDPVFELKLTPNRPDCFGVYGIARDLAAAGMGKLKPFKVPSAPKRTKSPINVQIDLQGEDRKACPYFIGRYIKGVKNGPSPEGMQGLLRAIGQKPISALVDVTNYLTFDAARPLHVFDAAKIKGNIHVRFAVNGEKLLALNGKEYALDDSMTVIADDEKALAIAGIIGGMESGCTEATTDVFLECAYFDPVRTARTGRKLQIISDARTRFERGVDPAFMIQGAEFATQMILKMCGNKAKASPLVIAGEMPDATKQIELRSHRCGTLGGLDVPVQEQEQLLKALGCKVKRRGQQFEVGIPSFRPDMEGEADCVEEILRLKGYEAIAPVSMANVVTEKAGWNWQQKRKLTASRVLASRGLLEAVTWSFMPSTVASLFGNVPPGLRLQNPISAELDVMRGSILPNLLLAAKRNAGRGFPDVGLFEIGPVYIRADENGQIACASGLRAGLVQPRHWSGEPRPADLYDAKADALAALAAVGVNPASLQTITGAPSWYHPGRSGVLKLGNAEVAQFGEIHPAILQKLDIKGPAVGFEVMLDAVPAPKQTGPQKPLAELPDLQPVRRDFAFVLDKNVEAEKLVKAVKLAERNLIEDVTVFDLYEGEHVGAGQKSLAIEVRIQPREKTLTEAELEALSEKITAAAAKATGAVLRK